jgi:hypothetical protein
MTVNDYVSWEAIGIRIKNVSSDFKIPENPFQLDKSFHGLSLKHFKEKAIAASKFNTKEGLAGSMILKQE